MGIYDRDYYREGTGGYRLGLPNRPTVVILGALYVLLFLLQQFTRERQNRQDPGISPVTVALSLDSTAVTNGELWRPISYAFTPPPHDVFPLLCALLFLGLFARHVEDAVGSGVMARLVFLAALFGAGLKIMTDITLGLPQPPLLGPGATITAILTLYALLYPKRIVYLIVIPLPAWMLPPLCIAVELALSPVGLTGGLIAIHAGGVLAALLMHQFDQIEGRSQGGPFRRRRESDYYTTLEPTPEYAPPMRSGEPSAASAAAAVVATIEPSVHLDEHTEAKVDELLEKLNNHGWDSLSEAERATLKRASEILKRKRDHK
jgi:membrane associated rhomboid family serine protease